MIEARGRIVKAETLPVLVTLGAAARIGHYEHADRDFRELIQGMIKKENG